MRGVVGRLKVAVFVHDLPLAGFAPVDAGEPDRGGGEGPAVHAYREARDASRPCHFPAHIERDDLVGDIAAAGKA